MKKKKQRTIGVALQMSQKAKQLLTPEFVDNVVKDGLRALVKSKVPPAHCLADAHIIFGDQKVMVGIDRLPDGLASVCIWLEGENPYPYQIVKQQQKQTHELKDGHMRTLRVPASQAAGKDGNHRNRPIPRLPRNE